MPCDSVNAMKTSYLFAVRNWSKDTRGSGCSGQFTEYFQCVVVEPKPLCMDVQTSTWLENLIYTYGKKLNQKNP